MVQYDKRLGGPSLSQDKRSFPSQDTKIVLYYCFLLGWEEATTYDFFFFGVSRLARDVVCSREEIVFV